MFNIKTIAMSFIENFNDQINELLNVNRGVKEAEQNVKEFLAENRVNYFEFEDFLNNLLVAVEEVAYFKGIEDGASLHYELVSGNIVNNMMSAFDEKMSPSDVSVFDIKAQISLQERGVKHA